MHEYERYNCKFFGLGEVRDVQTQTVTDDEQAELHVVFIDSDDGGKTVTIEYPKSYWALTEIYTSLTCQR